MAPASRPPPPTMNSRTDPPESAATPTGESPAAALQTVLRITEAVSQSKSVEDLIERALDAIVAYTRFPCCGLFRVDPSGTRAEMVGHRNVSPEVYAAARSLPLADSLTGHAIRSRRVVTTSDLAADPRLHSPTRIALSREGFTEVASIPLLYRDEALGTVNLIFRPGDSLADSERDALLGIGQTIAIALAYRMAEDQQRKLQEQVRQAEQIQHLGLLAGGLAHDFNNLLTCILGSLSLGRALLREGGDSREMANLLEAAEKASHRAAALVQQLLTFSKGGAPVLRATRNLASFIRESAEFSVHGSSVRLAFEIAPNLDTVEIDPAQISRMMQNLVLNAIQASPDGGTVTIEARNEPPGALDAARASVRIVVTDQGGGIPLDILPHIFEPYFSTKQGGSGLGLPTVRSIVGAHGGTVQVASTVGKGTSFLIHLPCSLRPAIEDPPAPSLPPSQARVGSALVMDDEPAVRSLARQLLERQGYAVVEASDGGGAVRACEQSVAAESPFSLVLLDLTIVGGAGGRDTMPRIRKILPDVAAVVCSGYSEDAAMSEYARHGFDAVLPKPYTVAQFTAAVREAHRARQR